MRAAGRRRGGAGGLAALALPAALALLAACGVPAEDAPRAIPAESVRPLPDSPPVSASVAPPGSAAGDATTSELCFTRDERLVQVTRRGALPATVSATVRDLLAGPTVEESAAELETALGGAPLLTGVRLSDGLAVVTLRSGTTDSARSDDVLALGQVVCTLATRPDVRGVVFERDGRRVAVPRGDGSLSEGPLRVADFAELLATPAPAPAPGP